MKTTLPIFSILFLSLLFSSPVLSQKAIKKAMDKAMEENQKSGKFYIAKFPVRKGIEKKKVKKFCKPKYLIRNIREKRIEMFGASKKVVTSFEFRDAAVVKEEEMVAAKARKEFLAKEKVRKEKEIEEKRIKEEKALAEAIANQSMNAERFLLLQDSALIFYEERNVALAKEYLLRAIERYAMLPDSYQSEVFEYSNALQSLGIIYSDENNVSRSKSMFTKALTIREELAEKDTSMNLYYGETLISLGHLYFQSNNNRKAESMFRTGIEKVKPFGDISALLFVAYGDLGLIYQEWKYYKDAIDCYQNARTVYQELTKSEVAHFQLLLIERRLGICYFLMGEYKRAEPHLVTSVTGFRELAKTNKNFHTESELVRSLMLLGELNIEKLYNPREGIAQLEEALEVGKAYPNTGDRLFEDYLRVTRRLLRKHK